MPSRLYTNCSSRRVAWLSMLVAFACASGCCPLFVSSRGTVPAPVLDTDDGQPVPPSASPNATCGSPQGVCTCGACALSCKQLPRLPRPPHPRRLFRWFGPLFHWQQASEEAAMAEAELYPPHSRFHPVPTAPVFAQRFEYAPPEPMMQTVPEHRFPHLAPQPNSAPSQPAAPLPSPEDTEPAPFFVPSAEMPAEPIPPGASGRGSQQACCRHSRLRKRWPSPGQRAIAPTVAPTSSDQGPTSTRGRKNKRETAGYPV